MAQRPKPGAPPESAAGQEWRYQEVLRANRELAAYFKGRRTEREARGALKIIKAFVRDRERRGARNRPLPGTGVPTPKAANAKRRHKPRKVSGGATASIQPPANPDSPQSSDGKRASRVQEPEMT